MSNIKFQIDLDFQFSFNFPHHLSNFLKHPLMDLILILILIVY